MNSRNNGIFPLSTKQSILQFTKREKREKREREPQSTEEKALSQILLPIYVMFLSNFLQKKTPK